jgi:epoxyqueuosine reductase
MPAVIARDRLLAASVVKEEARREGFSRVGIARAQRPPRFDRFERWLEEGRHVGMAYLEKTREIRASPERLLSGARSVVCLAAPHDARPRVAGDGSRVARYAAGSDYHGTLRRRALRVARAAVSRLGSFRFRVCVDSTPVAERSLAAAAGVGWIGKNGCLIDPELGSYLLLAEIVTELDLPADDPAAERCGSCVRCLEACPTGAFLEPGLLDASRCIAYWTIEHRGAIPDAVKPRLEDWVFGCDICQEVCPWNRAEERERGGAEERAGPSAREGLGPSACADHLHLPTRREWLEMGPGKWRREWGATALNRAGRRGVQRNAAASAGASADSACLPVLQRTSRTSERGLSDASAWALGCFSRGGSPGTAALRKDV